LEPKAKLDSLGPEWDQLSIETPELVALDMPVAGIGSRFVAILVDYLIWTVAVIAIVIVIALVDPSLSRFSKVGEKWATAISIAIPFLLFWGYFTLFEAFWDGRTPGKRIAKIRVIQRSGRGIGLLESMTRNLLRIVDQFPGIYAVGVVSIFLTRDHQRLGDLAAGTLVIHDRENLAELSSTSSGRTFTAGMFDQAPIPKRPSIGLDGPAGQFQGRGAIQGRSVIQGLGVPDLEVLEGFFARRLDFSLETRALLAARIADGIRAKTGLAAPPEVSTETFLEEVARQLRDLSRLG
jgi:uncharacterized RDD family membrane protein YckC